jgi:hypothetical protein
MKLIQANLAKLRAIPLPAGKSEIRIFDPELTGFAFRIRAGSPWKILCSERGR